jgi:hypothetical protein
MRRVRFVSLSTLLIGICATALGLQPQSNTAARPSFPSATGPRYPTATQTPQAVVNGAKHVTAKQLTRDQMEHFLLTARIISEKPIGIGITHTMRMTLTDGKIYHDAHVQTIDVYKAEYRTKEGVEKNFTDSYKYNIAAYRLDKMMDMGMVPVCVYRVVDDKPAAADWWVDDVMFDEAGRRDKNVDPPDLNYWGRQMNDVRDFDQLIYNVDRNQGNLLIDREWKVWAIDHSRSFRLLPTLRDPQVLRRISNKLLQGMKGLNEQNLEANLLPYVSKDAIHALLARRDLLVNFFENQITQKGPEVVLTDLPRRTERVTIP